MEEITFSVFNHGPAAFENLKTLLQSFERQFEIRVRLDLTQLASLRWPRLLEAALYHSGPDISEVGNSWVGDLVSMDSLRSFSREEVNKIKKGGSYFSTIWQRSIMMEHDTSAIYSIPFSGDVRIVFYRRDLLKNAGVDETTAFKSLSHFERTLVDLKHKGITMPLVLPNRRSNMTLHCCASWVWAKGGEFLSSDGTSLAFDQPKALEGFITYFRLVRHLVPEARDLEEHQADSVFCDGKAAILMSGFWVPSSNMADEVRRNLGVAPMPGIPFLGGGDLVIWNHSRHESSALKLIQFIHEKEAGRFLYPWFGLPIREEDWSDPPFNTESYQVFKDAIQNGRSFPPGRLWGLVEKRLTDTLADIWNEVLKSQESKLDAIVEFHLKNLAHRLQPSMGS